jgi:hypothetical protein
MLTDEQKAKLTPEQIVIAEKWMEEDEKIRTIYDKLFIAIEDNNEDDFHSLIEEISNTVPHICEHGKSIYDSCTACDAIEKVIRPELYDDNGDRIYDLQKEEEKE